MPGYEFRALELDAGGLAQCAAVLGTALTPLLDRAYLTWLYAENPAGTAVGFNAFHDGMIVAHYVTIPVAAWLNGRIEKGLLSLNTATHGGHRGRGLFPLLAERTYSLGAESGYGFVIGVGNARSTPGLTQKLGFQLVAPLDVQMGIGEFESMPGPTGRSYASHWTDDAIAWRLRRPGARYVAGRLHGDQRDVFATVPKLGVLACLDRISAGLAAALPPAKFASPLRLRIGLDRAARSSGVWVKVPDWIKPSPLNLIFRDLGSARRTLDADHVRWTLLDFDAY